MLFDDKKKRSPTSQANIRRSYEAVLNCCARLVAFSTSLPIRTDGELLERQSALAIDDLVMFSLNARRLIEDTDSTSLAKNVSVPQVLVRRDGEKYVFPKRDIDITIWKLIGIIIHHEFIDLLRDGAGLLTYIKEPEGDIVEAIFEIQHEMKITFNAKLLIRSDKSAHVLVDLTEFVSLFIERVFQPIIDQCAEDGIFLERSFYET